MKAKHTYQQKIKVLNKLFESGCNTEKKLQQLNMERILSIPNISILDITIITELQKQGKANRLFSYLGGGVDEVEKGVEEGSKKDGDV